MPIFTILHTQSGMYEGQMETQGGAHFEEKFELTCRRRGADSKVILLYKDMFHCRKSDEKILPIPRVKIDSNSPNLALGKDNFQKIELKNTMALCPCHVHIYLTCQIVINRAVT